MAYDEGLAQRVEDLLETLGAPDVDAKKMFGGVGYLVGGNMACGVHKDFLIVRVGPQADEDALERDHAAPFDITGRPMTGWVMVSDKGYEKDADLERWVKQGVAFALTLPGK